MNKNGNFYTKNIHNLTFKNTVLRLTHRYPTDTRIKKIIGRVSLANVKQKLVYRASLAVAQSQPRPVQLYKSDSSKLTKRHCARIHLSQKCISNKASCSSCKSYIHFCISIKNVQTLVHHLCSVKLVN